MSIKDNQACLDAIIAAIQHITAGEVQSRVACNCDDEQLEAVRAGINRLAEGLEARQKAESDHSEALLNILEDVNATKDELEATAENLKASENRMQAILANLPTGILIIDSASHIILEANSSACRLIGEERAGIVGRQCHNFICTVEQGCCPIRVNGIQVESSERTLLNAAGEQVPIIKSVVPIELDGKPCLVESFIDISDRKDMEDQIKDQNAFLENIIESLAHPFLVIDPHDYTIEIANSAARGSSGEESNTCHALTHSSPVSCDSDEHPCPVQAVAATGKPVTVEHCHINPEGGLGAYEVHGYPVFNDAGDVSRVIEYSLDITERKEAEQALREKEERFRVLFNSGSDIVFVHGYDRPGQPSRFLEVNDSACEALGYTREELLGMTPLDISDPDDEAGKNDTHDNLIKQGRVMFERHLMARDGRRIPCEMHLSTFELNGEQLALAVARDISERKIAEAALRESEERYRTLFEHANDMIQSLDLQGRFQYVNPQWCRVMGYTAEELKDMTIFDVLRPGEREHCIAMFEQVMAGETLGVVQTVFKAKDGRDIHVEGSSQTRIENGAITGTVGMFRDISERRSMQQELLKTQKLESIGVLAAGIAHDFNNFLQGITGNINLVRMKLDDNPELTGMLDQAAGAAKRAKELSQQLLTFSKGGAPVKKTASIAKFLEQTVPFILSGKNLKSRLELPDNLWPAEIDKGQLNQVINNLIINASQAMPDGGDVFVDAQNIFLEEGSGIPLPAGRYVQIDVTDTGHGIPPEMLSKIFDPFFTTKRAGSGLGLASVFSIVQGHGGHISVNSTVGEGTTFSVYLPATENAIKETAEFGVMAASAQKRILLMDDEEMIRMVTGQLLEEMGYSVDTAVDGAEAIELYTAAMASDCNYDAVIMDLTIPGGMGGKDAAAAIKAIDPEACLVVSSGYSNDPVMADYRDYGFSGRVAKPYEISELCQALTELLNAPTT